MSAVTISVVSHGHEALLHRMLCELEAFDELAGSTVVVTLNLAEEHFDASSYTRLNIVVMRNQFPRGFGANHNAAFRHCKTSWFAVLNPDLQFSAGNPFPDLLDTAARVGDVGVIAPCIVDISGRVEDAVRENLTPWSILSRKMFGRSAVVDTAPSSRQGQDFFWLAGMFLLLESNAYRDVGGFDERFFLYCEDYDVCARLYCAGYTIAVAGQAKVVHDARRHSNRVFRYFVWHLQALVKVWTSRVFWRVTLNQASAGRGY